MWEVEQILPLSIALKSYRRTGQQSPTIALT